MARWRTILLKVFFVSLVVASMVAQWHMLTFWGFLVCITFLLLIVFYERVFRKKQRKN